jgi:hypothetical protein
VGRKFQLVALKGAEPCGLRPRDPPEFFKDGANRGIKFAGIRDLMSDGIQRIQALHLRARIFQHDRHHAEPQEQIHHYVRAHHLVSMAHGIQVQEQQHCGQYPAPQACPAPGKPDKLH